MSPAIPYRKNLAFAAACLGMLLFGMVFISLGTISLFIQDKLRIDAIQVGTLASFLPFGMLAGSLIFGPVVDRYGYKIVLTLSAALITIVLEGMAFTHSFVVLQVTFFGIGLGGGVINGTANALAAEIAAVDKGARLSLLGVFYGIGALGMPLLIGVLTQFFRYEALIAIIGLLVLMLAFFFLLLKFPDPKHKKGFPFARAVSLLKEPVLLLTGMVLFFQSALEGITGNWATTYLSSVHITAEHALYALSAEVATIAMVRLLLSRALKHITVSRVMAASLMLMLSGSVLLSKTATFPMAILSMVLLGAGFAAGFPVMLGLVGERYPEFTGTAFSIVIVLALTGNTLLNYLVGLMSRTWDIQKLPLMMIFCIICMTLFITLAIRKNATTMLFHKN